MKLVISRRKDNDWNDFVPLDGLNYINQTGLKLRELPAPVCRVLGLKVDK